MLTRFIAKAIKINAKHMELNETTSELSFSTDEIKRVMYVSYCSQEHGSVPRREFDKLQWYRIKEFLKPLPDQPICMEFKDFGGGFEIELTGFVANF